VTSTSKVCSALPHFVELLVTRAIGTEGFATGGVMRSPPGDTMSWASHGATIKSILRATARSAPCVAEKTVAALVAALGGGGGDGGSSGGGGATV
jgi:hypothetical protein